MVVILTLLYVKHSITQRCQITILTFYINSTETNKIEKWVGPSDWNILVISNLETAGSFTLFSSKTKKVSLQNSNCCPLHCRRRTHKEKQGQEMERGDLVAGGHLGGSYFECFMRPAPRSPSCTWWYEPVILCFPSLWMQVLYLQRYMQHLIYSLQPSIYQWSNDSLERVNNQRSSLKVRPVGGAGQVQRAGSELSTPNLSTRTLNRSRLCSSRLIFLALFYSQENRVC